MAFALALTAAMLAFAPAVVESAKESLVRFAMSALPSLLPFMIAAKLIMATGAGVALGAPFRPLVRWLGLPESASGVLAASIIAGYPAGARLTADLSAEGELSDRQTETLAMAASHPGPLFIMGIVAPRLGGSLWGLVILAACTTGGIVSAKLVARASPEKVIRGGTRTGSSINASPLEVLPDIIRESCVAMLPVCGSMVFFGVLLGLLRQSGVFNIMGAAPGALVTGVFEMVAGCEAALGLQNGRFAAPLCAMILGWGGLSVTAQSLTFLRPHGVTTRRMLLGKSVQSAVAGGLVLAAAAAFYVPARPAWSGPPASDGTLWWFPLAWLAIVIFLCWFIYRCSRARKS